MPQCNNSYILYGKRMMDIIISLLGIMVLSPFFFLIIIMICLESPGTPFFFQPRVGLAMKRFRLVKFRSMISSPVGEKKQFEPGKGQRVTRVGKILRKSKFDEIPELFNVLVGDMSIVGPRPEVEKYVLSYHNDFRDILKIRPGLTDFASIKYRNEEEILSKQNDSEGYYRHVILPDKLYLAKKYANIISFKTDLSILINTLKSIVTVR